LYIKYFQFKYFSFYFDEKKKKEADKEKILEVFGRIRTAVIGKRVI